MMFDAKFWRASARFFSAFLFVGAMTVAAMPTRAQSQLHTAEDLVQVLNYSNYYTVLSKGALEVCVKQIQAKRPSLTADQIDSIRGQLQKQLDDYRKTFLARIATAYRVQFAADDIDKLYQFYDSAVGRKVREKQALIQDQVGEATQDLGLLIGASAAKLSQ